MYFASDNTGPTHPNVMQAMIDANRGFASPYGDDDLMDQVRQKIRSVFEAPDAAVYLVATGTAGNSLALATLAQPWQTAFCTPLAHIHMDECNAPEFYTGGAKLSLVGEDDKMTADALRASVESWVLGDVHVSQRGPVAITQLTEMGRAYTCEELQALTGVARTYDLPTFMDGARFSNALVSLGCTPAEMTWKAGIDVVTLGGTKNGCAGVEAVVFFDPTHAWEFELRRKRGAHLFSKHRYLSAQMLGYLNEDTWLGCARAANDNCARLVAGLRNVSGMTLLCEPQGNMVFATLPRRTHRALQDAGAVYGLMGPLIGQDDDEPLKMRLVCDWSISHELIETFIAIAKDSTPTT